MFSFTVRTLFIYSFVLVLFLFHAFADAGLVRRQGRGGVTVSFPTIIILMPDSALTPIANQVPSNFNSIDNINVVTTPPGFPMQMSVPKDCFVELANDIGFVQDPCYYEFVYGQQLELIGMTSRYFSLAVNVMQKWEIFDVNEPFNALFEFSTPYVSVNENPYDQSSSNMREMYMNASMPLNMKPGEYLISTTFSQSAPDGYHFQQIDSAAPEVCVEVDAAGNIECFMSRISADTTLTYQSIWKERLLVISEPSSLFIMLAGLFFIRNSIKIKLLSASHSTL